MCTHIWECLLKFYTSWRFRKYKFLKGNNNDKLKSIIIISGYCSHFRTYENFCKLLLTRENCAIYCYWSRKLLEFVLSLNYLSKKLQDKIGFLIQDSWYWCNYCYLIYMIKLSNCHRYPIFSDKWEVLCFILT